MAFDDKLYYGTMSEVNPFLSKFLLVVVFITAAVTLSHLASRHLGLEASPPASFWSASLVYVYVVPEVKPDLELIRQAFCNFCSPSWLELTM